MSAVLSSHVAEPRAAFKPLDRADRLFARLTAEAAAYAKRVEASDRTTALNHEVGALHGHLRGLMAELDRFKGTGQKPRMGCGLATVSLGEADVLVEFEYEAGEEPNLDLNSPMCGPGHEASLTVIQLLNNGTWIDPEGVIDSEVVEGWERQILEGETDQQRQLKDASDEARWEAQQEALAERGYP